MNKIEKAIKMTQALECELRDIEMCDKALKQLECNADISVGDVCIASSQEYDRDVKLSTLDQAEIVATIVHSLRNHRSQCRARVDKIIDSKGGDLPDVTQQDKLAYTE